MAKKKKRRISRKETTRRRLISAGVRRYWKRVKRLAKKSKKTLRRARKLYKFGLGRPKSERKKRSARTKSVRTIGLLWKGSEFVTGFEENQRDWMKANRGAILKGNHAYICKVSFETGELGEEKGTDEDEEIGFTAKGEDMFWSEWWLAAKEWMALIVQEFEPANLVKENLSPDGACIVTRVTYSKPGEV